MAVCPKGFYALVGSIQGCCLLIDLRKSEVLHRWQAHSHRLILTALWYKSDLALQAFTSSVEGSLDWWDLLDGDAPKRVHTYKGNSADIKPGQIISSCTHKAICGLFGDIRGKLHLCDLRPERPSAEESLCLVGVHGKDKISTLASHGNFFYSGGHNGIVLEHCVEQAASSALYVRTTRSFKCGPVASIFYIRWAKDGNMILGGFAYEKFYLWDATDGYLLHQETCGGWRRPSALSLTEELEVTFLYWPPVKASKKVPCLAHSSIELGKVHAEQSQNNAIKLLQRTTIGNSSHSRTIWAATFLSSWVWITGCENGVLKLHRRSKGFGGVDTMETLYGHGSAVRALHSLEVGDSKFLVVSGGGRQILRCWFVQVIPTGTGEHQSLETLSECLCEHAPFVAETDHTQRILAVCCTSEDPQKDAYLVYSGDSNGFVKVYRLTRPPFPGAPRMDESTAAEIKDKEDDAARVAAEEEGLSKKARKKREWQRVRKQDRQTRFVHTGRHTCRMSENATLTHLSDLQSGPGKPILCLGKRNLIIVLSCSLR